MFAIELPAVFVKSVHNRVESPANCDISNVRKFLGGPISNRPGSKSLVEFDLPGSSNFVQFPNQSHGLNLVLLGPFALA